jgi:hypothetical protein
MALARSRRLGITESPTGCFGNWVSKKAAIFAQRGLSGQCQIVLRPSFSGFSIQQYQYQNFLILVLLDEK